MPARRVRAHSQVGDVLETAEHPNDKVWLKVYWEDGDQTWIEEWEVEEV